MLEWWVCGKVKLFLDDGPPAAATSVHDHFCDYATGPRPLAANHKNDIDRRVKILNHR